MNIILTRPLIDTEDLMARILSLGHQIIHVPTLKILPSNKEIIDLGKFDVIIFSSANAIRNLKFKNKKESLICFCVGSITEKIARLNGFQKTFSAGGTVLALQNLIMNSEEVKKDSKIVYVCGDNISYDLDKLLITEGYNLKKIVNYISLKIVDLNDKTLKLIKDNPPHFIFIYSKRSAESFVELIKKYSLSPMMTESIVMCISKKIADIFSISGWKKVDIFSPGEELIKLEKHK